MREQRRAKQLLQRVTKMHQRLAGVRWVRIRSVGRSFAGRKELVLLAWNSRTELANYDLQNVFSDSSQVGKTVASIPGHRHDGQGCGNLSVTEPRAVATGLLSHADIFNKQRAGRIHHPKRAARLGTPVRSRFCNDGFFVAGSSSRATVRR